MPFVVTVGTLPDAKGVLKEINNALYKLYTGPTPIIYEDALDGSNSTLLASSIVPVKPLDETELTAFATNAVVAIDVDELPDAIVGHVGVVLNVTGNPDWKVAPGFEP